MGARYYYISDAKVDMLLPQIFLAQKHEIATELKVSLPSLIEAKVGTKRMALENRVSRAKAVETYLSKRGCLSRKASASWFSGTLVGKSVLVPEVGTVEQSQSSEYASRVAHRPPVRWQAEPPRQFQIVKISIQ